MGLLQSLGIAVKPDDFTPKMEIVGQYACGDKNPEIEVSTYVSGEQVSINYEESH